MTPAITAVSNPNKRPASAALATLLTKTQFFIVVALSIRLTVVG
jgi:hypothetical protein